MAFEGEMPTAPLVVGGIIFSPVIAVGLAGYGIFAGVKALGHVTVIAAKHIGAAVASKHA